MSQHFGNWFYLTNPFILFFAALNLYILRKKRACFLLSFKGRNWQNTDRFFFDWRLEYNPMLVSLYNIQIVIFTEFRSLLKYNPMLVSLYIMKYSDCNIYRV